MTDSEDQMSKEDRDHMITEFEQMGLMSFKVDEDKLRFDTLVQYTKENQIPVFTSVDEKEGLITIQKRPMGSLELF